MTDVESIFNAALDRADPREREAFLRHACGQTPGLRTRVEALLDAHASSGGFLVEPAVPAPAGREALVSEGPGDRIGDYVLRERLGEGGCGIVYRAEQLGALRRDVALKVIKLGMDTKQVIARFEAERQALALTDHLNIARVYDAGATESGRPYFVMELVRGIAVHRYCDRHRLPIPERLALFVDVCRAVQHAHQKGLVHRDLKPSNVLVTVQEGQPVPKVIDFGVAKATTGRLTNVTLHTELGQLLGTPVYMSPEQAEMSGLDIDTRTDVYSLGVLLYELLTGATPFDGQRLRDAGLAEWQRILREEEPPPPSTRVQRLGEAAEAIAHARGLEQGALVARLRGDLDWIILRALEKDRTRRYATPDALAADLTRHLRSEPVSAGPPSTTYLLRKFVRRNQLVVTAGAAVLLALVLGVAFTAMALVRAADRGAFFQGMVEYRYRALGTDELVVRARRVFGRDHGAVAMALTLHAQVLQDLGELARAEDQLRAALALWTERAASGPNVVLAHAELGGILLDRGVLDEAQTHLDRAMTLGEDLAPRPAALLAEVYADRARLLSRRGDFPGAAASQQRSVAALRAAAPDQHGRLGRTLEKLAEMYETAGRGREGAAARREATEELVRAFPDTVIAADQHIALGLSFQQLPSLAGTDEAERNLREGLAIYRQQPGLQGVRFLTGLVALADLLVDQDDAEQQAEGERLWVEALRLAERLHGDSMERVRLLERRAGQLEAVGRLDEAKQMQMDALEVRQRALRGTLDPANMLASAARVFLPREGQADDVETLGRALDLLLRIDPLAGPIYSLPDLATRKKLRGQGIGQVTDMLALSVLSAKMGRKTWARVLLDRARPLARTPEARADPTVTRLLTEAEAVVGD